MLTLQNISVKRGSRCLFTDVSCVIRPSTITVVLGANGTGKSSLLLAIAGLIPVTGKLLLHNKPLHDYPQQDLAQHIAWQGELPPTEFGLTVSQRLSLVTTQTEKLEAVAIAMLIMPLLHRPLGELSSGERQRVELAALMLRDAGLWLLDEPTSHLDLQHQIQCIQMLKTEASCGRAIVVVLHDLQQAMAVADDVILINKTGVVQYGAAKRLCNSQTLSALFDAPLMQKEGVLIPSYNS